MPQIDLLTIPMTADNILTIENEAISEFRSHSRADAINLDHWILDHIPLFGDDEDYDLITEKLLNSGSWILKVLHCYREAVHLGQLYIMKAALTGTSEPDSKEKGFVVEAMKKYNLCPAQTPKETEFLTVFQEYCQKHHRPNVGLPVSADGIGSYFAQVPGTGTTLGMGTTPRKRKSVVLPITLFVVVLSALLVFVLYGKEIQCMVAHDYQTNVVAPTCAASGYTEHICNRCGDTYTDKQVPALGHSLVNHEESNPTCSQIGWSAYTTCTNCDYTTYQEKRALGHAFSQGDCTRCGMAGWDGSVSTAWYTGDQTEYTLQTAAELAGLAQLVNEGEKFTDVTIKLSTSFYMDNKAWTPIGMSENKSFRGTFDGCGYTIEALSLKGSNGYDGLFGYVNGGTVKNVTIQNSKINISSDKEISVGLVVGYIKEGIITNCNSKGSIKASADGKVYAGGLVGRAQYTKVDGCHANVTIDVTSESYGIAGGLIGELSGTSSSKGSVNQCSAAGSVTMDVSSTQGFAGGLIAEAGKAVITDCYATGDVYGNTHNGLVSATTSVGGLIGDLNACEVRNCYAVGNVTGEAAGMYSDVYAGGLIGSTTDSDTISNCFAAGDVTATSTKKNLGVRMGGLIAVEFWEGAPTINNCYRSSSQSVTSCESTQEPNVYSQGTETSLTSIQSSSFRSQLKWDSSIWNFANGVYPTLID